MLTHGAHLVFVTSPAWGHLRYLIQLAAKIVLHQASAPPGVRTIITVITVGSFSSRIKNEIALAFDGESSQPGAVPEEHIRVVSMGGEGTDMLNLFPVLVSQFPTYYDLLASEKPVPCKATGTLHPGIQRPKTAVIDVVNFPAAQAIRASTHPIPIVGSAPLPASVVFRILAPQHLNGFGYLPAWVTGEIKKGRTAEDAGADAVTARISNKGDVIRIPGMPPFYDYETCPQEPSSFIKWDMIAGVWDILMESSAIILDSTSAYEPLTIPALCSLRDGTDKTIYPVGPLVPLPRTSMCSIGEDRPCSGDPKDEVIAFLDDAERMRGRHSVLYISFGTHFWPTKPEYAWTWLEALLEAGIPFVFSLASQRCTIPDELKSRIAASGLGVMPLWAPQHMILAHPATGWFMSHCGHNSIMEAMSAGVPVIAWPLEVDQPLVAAYIALVLEASIQLVQVRTGERGLRPMYRGAKAEGTVEAVKQEAVDVLRRAWGEEGNVTRRNAQGAKERLQSAWREGGDARKNLDAFLMRFA